MTIQIDNTTINVFENETVLEVIRRTGTGGDVPSLCYDKDAVHQSSCMVCAVKDISTGQIVPSCTTLPVDGMKIESDSDEIRLIRTLSLELLLSDHRADCEAPCKMVCPAGLDIAAMNRLYDNGQHSDALQLLRNSLVIPAILCYICSAPCEKICRRKEIDKSVAIREIKKSLVTETKLEDVATVVKNGKKIAIVGSDPTALSAAYNLCKSGYSVTIFEEASSIFLPHIQPETVPSEIVNLEIEIIKRTGIEMVVSCDISDIKGFDAVIATTCSNPNPDWTIFTAKTKQPARLVLEGQKLAHRINALLLPQKLTEKTEQQKFNSSFTRLTESEKTLIKEQIKNENHTSRCLYCDCDAKNNCKLRQYATDYLIKGNKFGNNSVNNAIHRQHIRENIWFEQAKCIRCGLCIYNSTNGFTFKGRGFETQVILPAENAVNIKEDLIKLCPTGALYVRKHNPFLKQKIK